MSQQLPLSGVTVLDLSRLLPGPWATQMLADMGAEVIKVEGPGGGDDMREFGPRLESGTSHMFANFNRNKKSVVLDLKDERGQERFLDLAEGADAVVEGFRPGVVDRLGVGYDDVRERNEQIVYVSVSGYGQDGEYVEAAGHDLNYISISGVLDLTGETGEVPTVPGVPVGDYVGGFMTAIAVLTGLWHARDTGKGEYFDVSMTDVLVSMVSYFAPWSLSDDVPTPTRGETLPGGGFPCYDVYETADGEYVTIGCVEYKFWVNFCEAVGLEDLANHDDHFPEGDRLEEVRERVADRLAEQTLSEWADDLDFVDVPWSPVNDLDEVWTDPQVAGRDLLRTLPDGKTQVADLPVKTRGDYEWVRETYPELGEHSRELLAEAGLSEAEVAALVEEGVVGDAR